MMIEHECDDCGGSGKPKDPSRHVACQACFGHGSKPFKLLMDDLVDLIAERTVELIHKGASS